MRSEKIHIIKSNWLLLSDPTTIFTFTLLHYLNISTGNVYHCLYFANMCLFSEILTTMYTIKLFHIILNFLHGTILRSDLLSILEYQRHDFVKKTINKLFYYCFNILLYKRNKIDFTEFITLYKFAKLGTVILT